MRKKKLTHGSLFSGIGGFDLAADRMGWENVFHCELNEFCRTVLTYYWPKSISYGDIKQTDFTIHRNRIDILSGGFPCQPFSLAGSRKGTADDRHLWPEMLRAIREIQPRCIIGENVPGIITWNQGAVFEEVQTDLENEGYQVQPVVLPACSIGANHIRERVWFFAYSCSLGWEDVQSLFGSSQDPTVDPKRRREKEKWWKEEADELDPSRNTFLRFQEMYGKSPIFNVDDGLPFELDGITVSKWLEQSHAAAGNAVDTRLVLELFKIIKQLLP